MKRILFFLLSLPLAVCCQVNHTVAPKETLYSLSRQYNISPKDLAAFNNISIETGLIIGQVIRIPSTSKTNATPVVAQTPNPKSAAVTARSKPIYHKVQRKETLYAISKKYKNSSVDDIKKWNQLQGDALTEGTNLIVGYSETANSRIEEPVSSTKPSKPGESKDKPGAVISKPVITDVKVQSAPEKKAEPVIVVSEPVVNKSEPVVVKEQPVVVKTEATPRKSEVVPAKEEPVSSKPELVVNNSNPGGKSFSGGYFKTIYDQQSREKTLREEPGTAATFKSTSGWEDGKYYCLHNTAPAGSIIKITNSNTQKSVYAKVLDIIPDLTQNRGIAVRLSNAAASELGAGEGSFESVITY